MPLSLPLKSAAVRLAGVCDNPRAEAEWLMAHVLACSRTGLLGRAADVAQLLAFDAAVARRLAGEPVAYITGEQPFRRLNLRVTAEVLIPRPETEQLVDWALALLRPGQCVLDLCTGSGCVAISLAVEMQGLQVWASDISAAALAIARSNAEAHSAQLNFVEADGLALPPSTPGFDLIVGNPPYIAENDTHLAALNHEPTLALVSGSDGLTLIRRLVTDARQRLNSGGTLLLEHGFDQAAAVRALMKQAGYVDIRSQRDYSGIERASLGRWA